MYLVDSSVWIDYLEGAETEIAGRLAEVLDLGYPFGITSVVYQEVLQGSPLEMNSTGLWSTWAPSPSTIHKIPSKATGSPRSSTFVAAGQE